MQKPARWHHWAALIPVVIILTACNNGRPEPVKKEPPIASSSSSTVSPSQSPPSSPAVSTRGEFTATPTQVITFAGPADLAPFTRETGGDGWGNNEAQYYTDRQANAYADGKLHIVAKRENFGGKRYTSGRLTTPGFLTVTYGKIVWKEVVLPKGRGTWPALWLWPAGKKYRAADMPAIAKGDQGSMNGEIDVMEWVGVEPNEINCSAHAYAHHPGLAERSGQIRLEDAAVAQPHDFWLEKTPERLTFGIDTTPYYTVRKADGPTPAHWPYDQPYFTVTNIAMGGDWGGMYANQQGLGSDGIDPQFRTAEMTIGSMELYGYTSA